MYFYWVCQLSVFYFLPECSPVNIDLASTNKKKNFRAVALLVFLAWEATGIYFPLNSSTTTEVQTTTEQKYTYFQKNILIVMASYCKKSTRIRHCWLRQCSRHMFTSFWVSSFWVTSFWVTSFWVTSFCVTSFWESSALVSPGKCFLRCCTSRRKYYKEESNIKVKQHGSILYFRLHASMVLG